jgi:tripartite-type tricarboxylate transporter receptor subunit TctC
VVPFPPGASNDIVARLVGQKLTEAWGQQFVIDNRPGAGGSLGASKVAEAAPDGYTLLVANPGPSINNVVIRRKPPYRLDDFAPVILIAYTPLVLVAHPAFPPRNAQELVAYAKANPGKVNWASSGVGSAPHIGLELFQAATGIKVTHVPYKGGAQALTEVVTGQVQVLYSNSTVGEVQIKTGRVKVLGVADSKKHPVLANAPTFSELGIKNADAKLWIGMSAPAKTPRAIIDKLNKEINRILALPEVRQRLDSVGLMVEGGTADQFGAFVKAEADRLARLVKAGAIEQE